MEEKILNEILKDTFTLEDFKKRVMALKLVLEKKIFASSQYKSGSEIENKALDNSMLWVQYFDKNILNEITGENFREIFEHIDHFISESTTLTIYFVFIPDENQIKEIGHWLRDSLGKPNVIFDYKIDPGLIGGCAIAYKGIYKDYSLKAKIRQEKTLLKEEFGKYLRH